PSPPYPLDTGDTPQHFTLFPLSLGQILKEFSVTEMHLSLNSGKWDYIKWGYPDAVEEGVGTGAELWAWMASDGHGGDEGVDARWTGLRNGLAGLFCASLTSMDDKRTTVPYSAFPLLGSLPSLDTSVQLRHASLPSENVCTENLTPFLKLLPCTSRSGIAQLLNSYKLFDADWHGMGVHVFYHGGRTGKKGVEVRLTFQAVFDPVRLSSDHKRDWSLPSLFGRTIERGCPVARSSLVRVGLPMDGVPYALSPDSHVVHKEEGVAVYDVQTTTPLDIGMVWPMERAFVPPLSPTPPPLCNSQKTPPVRATRKLTTSSQARGLLSAALQNTLDEDVQLLYTETMPWLVTFYMHTLDVTLDGVPRPDLMRVLEYVPSSDARPTLLQAALRIPPKGTLRINMKVEKAFLKYTDHMPDAQRGWDLPPAILTLRGQRGVGANSSHPADEHGRAYIYTPALLVDLATPDFSMPYNVIIMSCTLIALIFGSVFNLLTRRFLVVDVDLP
ncbi:GPI transamidase component GPI16, partial [Punctularia strigosozonata HHB-11173 SS5]|uniref:GPI transamidase component GPI16 n=1 Tax=Punctularia strigosozonata (strain HHB-11173) TaxID=741275 RepID=UPI000441843B